MVGLVEVTYEYVQRFLPKEKEKEASFFLPSFILSDMRKFVQIDSVN